VKKVRIGMVNYINTAPIYEEWKNTVNNPEWIVTEAPPSTLNQLLAEDRLDLGLVSSYEYAVRPHKYRILRDLSISATGPVGSVFLFSTVRPEELSDKLVLLTGQSETSIALVKIVLEEFYSIHPRYRVADIFDPRSYEEEVGAVLAIGDDALRLREEQRYSIQLDLADVWNKYTGLPFVFAVFAVREEFVAVQQEVLTEIWQTLINCRNNGKDRLKEISQLVAPRIPMDVESCYNYLLNIEHNLDSNHQQALKTFFQYLIKRGDISDKALPLKFFPDDCIESNE
jgi:chorismate dehydratase